MRRALGAGLALAFSLAGACAPIVTHGPGVEPGFSLGATAAADVRAFGGNDDPVYFPINASWLLQYGWRAPSDTGAAVLVGVNLPGVAALGLPLLQLTEGDLYVQLPSRPGAMQRGGGVLASAYHVMPYVQLGREARDGRGWYTTQGIAWVREIPQGDDYGRDAALAWMPAVAAYDGRRHVTVTGYVQGGLGLRRELRCVQQGCEPSRLPFWALVGGVSLQLHGARERR